MHDGYAMRIFYMLRAELCSLSLPLCANCTLIDVSRQTAGPRDELLFMTCMRNDAEFSGKSRLGAQFVAAGHFNELYESIANAKSNVDYIIRKLSIHK